MKNLVPEALAVAILPPWWRTGWAYAGYVLAFLLALYSLYRFQLNRQLARVETRRLKELDEVKTRLYTNITHEFRTPLTLILGMADQVSSRPQEWLDEGMTMIKRNGRQLLRLVNQMLDLAKLESGSLPVNRVQGEVITYLRYLSESFHSYAESRDISLQFRTEVDELMIDYDPEKLQDIVSNLLSNALKFTPPGGAVELRLTVVDQGKDSCLQIEVEDSGPGIPPEQLPHIFSRFYQGDGSSTRRTEGTGIGLALTKELVQLLGGTIAVESPVGEGTAFTVRLPITREAPPAVPGKERRGEPWDAVAPGTFPEAGSDLSSTVEDQPLLLIVEDNPDVIRYLTLCLEDTYQVVTADNGQTGIEQALERVPDLIISDVMMPEKDGFELCDTLKSDERTSHIPIVLLTAKADVQSRIAGLKRGADAYLPKPFHKEELLAQLANLLEQRRKLQQRYRDLPAEPPAVVNMETEIEDAFLRRLRTIVEANMGRPDFDITWLAAQVHMGRVQLYRKVKALTGRSPSLFVRSVRLQRAQHLLRTTPISISPRSPMRSASATRLSFRGPSGKRTGSRLRSGGRGDQG